MKLEFANYIVNDCGCDLRVKENYTGRASNKVTTGVMGSMKDIILGLVSAGMGIASDHEAASIASNNGEDASAEHNPDEYLVMIQGIRFDNFGRNDMIAY